MPKVFLKTYGCQMNERDSEQVSRMLIARGYEMTANEKCADGCSEPVRARLAEQRRWQDGASLAVCARTNLRWSSVFSAAWRSRGAELVQGMGHVDLVVGTQKFHKVADYVDELVRLNGLARAPDG